MCRTSKESREAPEVLARASGRFPNDGEEHGFVIVTKSAYEGTPPGTVNYMEIGAKRDEHGTRLQQIGVPLDDEAPVRIWGIRDPHRGTGHLHATRFCRVADAPEITPEQRERLHEEMSKMRHHHPEGAGAARPQPSPVQ